MNMLSWLAHRRTGVGPGRCRSRRRMMPGRLPTAPSGFLRRYSLEQILPSLVQFRRDLDAVSDNTGIGFSQCWAGLSAVLGPDQAFYAPQRARSSNKRALKDTRAGSSRCALPRYGRRTERLPDKYRCHRPRRPSRSCKRQQRRGQRWAYSDRQRPGRWY